MDHHLWVTLFDARQVYASGEWVNLMREGEGVAAWSAADRNIVDRDVVLWYTFAVTHLPRPEDWPVMPAHTAGFKLLPTLDELAQKRRADLAILGRRLHEAEEDLFARDRHADRRDHLSSANVLPSRSSIWV